MTPTISYDGTSIDLGYTKGTPRREIDDRTIRRRTLAGNLRTTTLTFAYIYKLDFTGVLTETYDSLVALWRLAASEGAYPTFAFTDVWATADDVEVDVEIGPLVWDIPGTDSGSFSLTLTEVNAR